MFNLSEGKQGCSQEIAKIFFSLFIRQTRSFGDKVGGHALIRVLSATLSFKTFPARRSALTFNLIQISFLISCIMLLPYSVCTFLSSLRHDLQPQRY